MHRHHRHRQTMRGAHTTPHPTSVTSMGAGACASEPDSSLAVLGVSVRAARPGQNTPSRTRMWSRMAKMISMLAFLPLVDIAVVPETADSPMHPTVQPEDHSMTKFALFVRLEAKAWPGGRRCRLSGRRVAARQRRSRAPPPVRIEVRPPRRSASSTPLPTRRAAGSPARPIAAALMVNAAALLSSTPPNIERSILLAAKFNNTDLSLRDGSLCFEAWGCALRASSRTP